MTDYGTIKIPKPAYEHHNERRQELGQTWEQYINGQAPDAPDPVDHLALAEAVADEVEARLR